MATEEVTGLVTNILNERQLVVSIGSLHGAKIDDLVTIYYPSSVVVLDPESGGQLGSFTIAKVSVKVISVFDAFSICETYQSRTEQRLSSAGIFPSGLFDRQGQGGTIVIRQTLRADDEAYPRPLEEKNSFVKIGDKAILSRPEK